MKKINLIAWIFLVKVLIGSIFLLAYDHWQTKIAIVEAETRMENAAILLRIQQAQIKRLEEKCEGK